MVLHKNCEEIVRSDLTFWPAFRRVIQNPGRDSTTKADMQPETETTERLYREFSNRLKHFIRKRVRDATAADDILQDAFLKIHSRIDALKDRDKMESWVFQITRNIIADQYRNQKVAGEPAENLAAAEEDKGPAERLAPCLTGMIEGLPQQYREALKLTEYEGMTQKEFAAKLGISVSGAKSRVQRARAMLKDALMQCCHFELDRYGAVIDYHPRTCSSCPPE